MGFGYKIYCDTNIESKKHDFKCIILILIKLVFFLNKTQKQELPEDSDARLPYIYIFCLEMKNFCL